jgi:hypothetical protein
MSDATTTTKKPSTRYNLRLCPCDECGAPFKPSRPRQVYCSKACKKARYVREQTQGAKIIALAKAWRMSKDSRGEKGKKGREIGARAFSELCRELDRFNQADRAATGRADALKTLARQYRDEVRSA